MLSEEHMTLSLRYVGRRFEGARLPVDVLSDLPALRDLVAALAKHEFRKKNPDRRRVPQGFDRAIAFSLVSVEEGSAIPKLEFDNEVAQQSLPTISDGISGFVEDAFLKIAELYEAATEDGPSQVLPLDAIRALSKFGAGIQENERIEFVGTNSKDGNVVSLDTFKRKKLLTKIKQTYTFEFEDVGILTGIDISKNTIQIDTPKFGEIWLPLQDAALSSNEFSQFIEKPIEFSISVELDSNDSLQSVNEVNSVDPITPHTDAVLKCLNRIQEISKAETGWLGDGQGKQLVHLAAMRATQLLFVRADLADLFKMYPTEAGGVSVEFDKGGWSFAVEILPDGKLELDAVASDGRVLEIQTFDGFSEAFWDAFDKTTSEGLNDED